MTGAERIDLGEMRREVRDGFDTLRALVRQVEDRVASLETTRTTQLALEAEKARRSLSRNNKIALTLGILGAVYTAIGQLHTLGII